MKHGKGLVLASILALAACSEGGTGGTGTGGGNGGGGGNNGGGNPGLKYDVTVTRTALGIPHIEAARNGDFGSAGYGYGYAHAQDNLCVLQEDLVTIRGERSRWFGRPGPDNPRSTYRIPANDAVADNIDSDFFWKSTATDAAWQRLRDSARPELKAVTLGFVDGWNRYIAEIKAGQHAGRHLACRAEPWVAPIGEADLYRRYYRLALLASSSVFISGIARAQPPQGLPVSAPTSLEAAQALQADPGPLKAIMPGERPIGSNMYALGKDAVAEGAQSMVFGNPHFPWTGTERLYIAHVKVPGKLDIMGASLYGVPAVLIGFNRHVAWSHTVSTAYRFTIYELTLNPLNPTQYVYGTELRDLQATPITIDILEADGSVTQASRTLYRSHYGPIIGLEVGVGDGVPPVNVVPWTNLKAYTIRDANAENDRLINQFAEWNQATSLDDFIAKHKSVLGIPWVNTVASGPDGPAYYGDVSVVPHVTDEQVQLCAAHPLHDVLQQVVPGLPVLDGSRADCEWGTDEDAPAPGIFGPANLPTLVRDDWVHNCNDSYWLTNPEQTIEGYNAIIGSERTERSLRTRLCIQQVARHLGKDYADTVGATFDGDGDQRFTLQELQETVLSSQIYSAQLGHAAVMADICPQGTVLTRDGPVDVAPACAVLGGWSLQDNLADVGGHIWREFFRLAAPNPAGLGPNPLLWTVPFSATDAANTPRGLNTLSPLVQEALGRAVTHIAGTGQALDAPMGSLQRSGVSDTPIPIFGGTGTEGAFTIVSVNNLDADGYRVTYGNSYIQTVTWEPDGQGFKPRAEGFITYSQSTDPANPHFKDFTAAYSAKAWKRFPFTTAEIAADRIGAPLRLTAPAP